MSNFPRPAGLLTLTAALLAASLAAAQQPMKIPRDNFSSAGKIKAIRGSVFHVVNVSGDQWLVQIEAQPQDVVLRGTAVTEWLRPGMLVEFKGVFAKVKSGEPQGQALQTVTKLKVFSPRSNAPVGLREEAAQGSFLADPAAKADAERMGNFTVRGLLTRLKSGRMTVAAGMVELRATLADDAEIAVDVADYRFAREGDEMEFEGWHYVGQKDRIHATKVTIRAATLLGTAGEAAAETAGAPTAQQRRIVRRIQGALVVAKRLYDKADYAEAAQAVVKILRDWDTLTSSGEAAVLELVEPHYKPLKSIHALLEMEGCELPPLGELKLAAADAGS